MRGGGKVMMRIVSEKRNPRTQDVAEMQIGDRDVMVSQPHVRLGED